MVWKSYENKYEVTRLSFEKLKMRWIMWLAGKLPPCREITEMVSHSLEEMPPLRERLLIRLHFSICVWCSRYRDQLLFMREAVRQTPSDSEKEADGKSPTLSPEARERLKRALSRKPE